MALANLAKRNWCFASVKIAYLAVHLAIDPVANVAITISVNKGTTSVDTAVHPVSVVDVAVGVEGLSLAVDGIFDPLALISETKTKQIKKIKKNTESRTVQFKCGVIAAVTSTSWLDL